MIRPPRQLDPDEILAVLEADVPARLATVDRSGFPHVTPLWFLWAEEAFLMTSFPDRPHLRRLRHDSKAGICVDLEDPQRPDGERPNRQVRAIGQAELLADPGGSWTRQITAKYVRGPVGSVRADQRAASERVVIRLRPVRMVAVASVARFVGPAA